MPLFGRRKTQAPAPTSPPSAIPHLKEWPQAGSVRPDLPMMPEEMAYLQMQRDVEEENDPRALSTKLIIREQEYSWVNLDRERLRDLMRRAMEFLEPRFLMGTYEEKALLKEMRHTLRESMGLAEIPDVAPFYPLGQDPRILDHLGRHPGEPVEPILSASGVWRDPRSHNDRRVSPKRHQSISA